MGRTDTPVNPRRAYDARRRQEQARRSRDAIIESAERRFLGEGYATTTIAAIADDAGVSVHTIYKSFGGKAGLIRAIRTKALEGSGPVPAEQRSDQMQATETDPRRILRGWGTLTAEVAPRVAPILLLMRDAAANDADVQILLDELDHDRLRRMRSNARRLYDGGHLRAGIGLAKCADLLWTYSAPELYELLVIRRGWTPRRYGTFIADALIDALLPD
jgi:AcrR family transcriptional regulator